MEALFIVLVIAVLLGSLLYGHWAAEKRRRELSAWATGKGLEFDPGRFDDMDGRYPGFQCLRRGENRYAENVTTGRLDGREVCAFDYHYETHSTDSKGRRQTRHHHFSAAVVSSDTPLQPLLIRPEGLLDKVAEFFGADDIDFESAEFSRRFYVKAPEHRWAFDVIHQRTMEFLLSMPSFSIQFSVLSAVAWRDRRFGATEFEQACRTVAGILERLPEYVRRQQRGET